MLTAQKKSTVKTTPLLADEESDEESEEDGEEGHDSGGGEKAGNETKGTSNEEEVLTDLIVASPTL